MHSEGAAVVDADVRCPVCRKRLSDTQQTAMTCDECGSLEGLELVAGGPQRAHVGRLFSYDWAGGFVAPFVPADLDVALAGIQQAAAVLRTVHGCEMEAVADLGCGDGRVLVHAARTFDLRNCWGVELDEQLIAQAREAAKQAGVAVSVQRTDLTTLPASAFPPATLIFCYLLPAALSKISSTLRDAITCYPTVLVTLRWAVPGLDDLRTACPRQEAAPGASYHIYCGSPSH